MKLITTLSLLLIGIVSFAQSTSMTIFNNNGQQFFVIMNGIKQNSLPQTNVKIGGMATGSYEIKLIFADGKTGDINKKVYLDVPGDYLARVVLKGKKRKLQWFGIPEGEQIPAGGTAIEYRQNDQSIYSDQQVSGTIQNNTNGQYGTMTQPSGQTYQSGQPAGTIVNGTPVTTGTVQPGTTTTTTTTGTPVTNDPNYGAGGTSTSNTTGQQSTTFGSSATIPDPNIPTGFGVHIDINPPNPATGGTVGISTTVKDPITGETVTTSTSATDPGMSGGNFGVSSSVSGTTSGSTATATSSSTTTQNGQVVHQSNSVTQNGQTTTTTSSAGNTGTTTTVQTPPATGTTTATTTTTKPVVSGNAACTKMLVDGDTFIASMNKETFNADKLEMIRKDLKEYCVTSDQAYRIINALTFEADKLEMSKFLYVRMSDKVNGKRLLELFTFDTDKKDFQSFMATH